MPLIEVDETEYNQLKRAKDLLNGLYTSEDQATRSTTRKGLKKLGLAVQDEDEIAERHAAPIRAKLEESDKRVADMAAQLEALKKAQDDRDALSKIHERIDEVVRKRKLTADGKDSLIKVMQERQIADPDAAALILLDSLPKTPGPSKASTVLPQTFNLLEVRNSPDKTDETIQKFWDNPQAAADEEVARILGEIDEAA